MQLTTQLAGRKIESVWRHENALVIRCEDGRELQIGWVDGNGNLLKLEGTPVILFAGLHVIAKPMEMEHRRESGLVVRG